MSVNLYDDAFVKKLQSWTLDTNIHVVAPDETERLFQQIADDGHDSPIKLPIISLTRDFGYEILEPVKQPLTFNGLRLVATDEQVGVLNAIPISIPYKLHVYTRYMREADELTRNLIFNIINYPKLTIGVPYHNLNYEHDSSIRLVGGVDDTSSNAMRIVSGQFTRLTLDLVVDDAYLFDIRLKNIISICPNPSIIVEDLEIED